jgi:hypothetical protein
MILMTCPQILGKTNSRHGAVKMATQAIATLAFSLRGSLAQMAVGVVIFRSGKFEVETSDWCSVEPQRIDMDACGSPRL